MKRKIHLTISGDSVTYCGLSFLTWKDLTYPKVSVKEEIKQGTVCFNCIRTKKYKRVEHD